MPSAIVDMDICTRLQPSAAGHNIEAELFMCFPEWPSAPEPLTSYSRNPKQSLVHF